ncbi:MAG: GTPase Era [Clostridia bacterium]|nr:GTPase Era [Clostridia bacterium]
MPKHKSGFVTVVGRPNVGKSTLINNLLGEKIAITSPKPQTTRNNMRAIITEKDYQIIFIDTPGIHKPKNKLGEFMVQAASSTFSEVDVVMYLYDVTNKEIPQSDLKIIDAIKSARNSKTKVFLIITKMDLVAKEQALEIIARMSEIMEFDEIIPVSAVKKDGTDIILKALVDAMPEGPAYFSEDILTDTNVREIAREIIREKILLFTNDEVPHGVGIEIVQFKEPKFSGGTCTIEANIYCEKNTHKTILIGKQGAMLKKIGTAARHDIEKLTGEKINLQLWVKVKTDWRNSPSMLKELGFKND